MHWILDYGKWMDGWESRRKRVAGNYYYLFLFYIEERKLNIKQIFLIFFLCRFFLFLCFLGHDWCIIKLGKNETIQNLK